MAQSSLAQRELVPEQSEAPRQRDRFALHERTRQGAAAEAKDYLVHEDGLIYAGRHLLIDLWGGSRLNDMAVMEQALREAVEACGATLLHIHLHEFTYNGGISGVAVLAESHISVHTWPEYDYAAFDVFTCGTCDPENAVPVLRRAFQPEKLEVGLHRRGVMG